MDIGTQKLLFWAIYIGLMLFCVYEFRREWIEKKELEERIQNEEDDEQREWLMGFYKRNVHLHVDHMSLVGIIAFIGLMGSGTGAVLAKWFST